MSRPRPDTSIFKRCCSCKEAKPRAAFYPSKSTFDGIQSSCRECQKANRKKWAAKNKQVASGYARRWRERNPRAAKDHKLRSTYGVPLGTYDRLLAEQGGKCAICGTDTPGGRGDFHVDHCHETGKVRGLLCRSCNVGIGHFNHSKEALVSAARYLSEGSRQRGY